MWIYRNGHLSGDITVIDRVLCEKEEQEEEEESCSCSRGKQKITPIIDFQNAVIDLLENNNKLCLEDVKVSFWSLLGAVYEEQTNRGATTSRIHYLGH